MGSPVVRDGAARGDERLGRDLAAEHPGHERAAALAPEDVPLDLLQVEQVEQIEQGIGTLVHGEKVIPYRPMDLAMIDFMTSLVPP